MKKILLLISLLAANTYAQTVVYDVTPRSILIWGVTKAMTGPVPYPINALAAEKLVHKYYLDGSQTGVTLILVTCVDNPIIETAEPITCQTATPVFGNGRHSLTLTISDAANESDKSLPVVFDFNVNLKPPINVRFCPSGVLTCK